MDRRILLAGLATAASLPLLQGVTIASAQSAAGKGEAEREHAERTRHVGSLSLETSRIALEKAQNEQVKTFATFEEKEQRTIADILMSMEQPADAAEGALKTPSTGAVEAMLDTNGTQVVEGLRAAEPGNAFDKLYVQGQLDAHRELLRIQEDYLKVGRDREHLSVAKLARATIEEHIHHLDELQQAFS